MHQLATLLMELDTEDESSRLLAADALYRLGHLDDAHKALLAALSRRPQAAPVLARLALLQLRRGFSYDANQVRGPQQATAGQLDTGHSAVEGTRPPLAPRSTPCTQTCPSPNLSQPQFCHLQQVLTSLTLSLLNCTLAFQVLMRISCSRYPRTQLTSIMQ